MRKRKREILLWLSDKDFRMLEKNRTAAGQTRQDYILELVYKVHPLGCPRPDMAKAKENIGYVGRLINDMAHCFNTTGQIDMDVYVSAVNNLHSHMMQLEEEIINENWRLKNDEQSERKA